MNSFQKTNCVFILESPPTNPCIPSPCGPNSQCKIINEQAVCSCLPTFLGVPPGCRPECTTSAECSHSTACINQKCVDPCPGVCGLNAKCTVINHNPICSCKQNYIGDPFTRCNQIKRKNKPYGTYSKSNPTTFFHSS